MHLTILNIHAPIVPLYLDPGTGSFLLQLLAGVVVGGLLAVKIYWRKLVSFFRKDQPTTDESEAVDDESSSSTTK